MKVKGQGHHVQNFQGLDMVCMTWPRAKKSQGSRSKNVKGHVGQGSGHIGQSKKNCKERQVSSQQRQVA